MTPSGAYRHAHVAHGPFFHPKDAMRHNRGISMAWTTFVLDKSEVFTKAGVKRLNDSIRTYVWAILGAQAQTRSNILKTGTGFDAQKKFLADIEDAIASPVDIPSSIARCQKTLGYASTPLDFVCGIGLYLMPSDMELHPGSSRGTTTRSRLPDPLFQTTLFKGRDRHADGCENRCNGNSLLTKQVANALSQCGVFMEEPSDCLTDSVDLRPEGCSVRGEGFEACLSFKLDVREYTLELFDSVLNLILHFSVVCFCQFSMLPGEVSSDLGIAVVDTRQLCQVVRQLICHSRHCLFEPSQLSSGLGDPHGVDWLIINRR